MLESSMPDLNEIDLKGDSDSVPSTHSMNREKPNCLFVAFGGEGVKLLSSRNYPA